MRIDIVTLFPELCDGFLSTSILGRARAKNLFEAHCHQIRDYTKNKQRQTDDYPYGGGCGMVLYAQPIADCLRAVADQCAQQGRAKTHQLPPAGTHAEHKGDRDGDQKHQHLGKGVGIVEHRIDPAGHVGIQGQVHIGAVDLHPLDALEHAVGRGEPQSNGGKAGQADQLALVLNGRDDEQHAQHAGDVIA